MNLHDIKRLNNISHSMVYTKTRQTVFRAQQIITDRDKKFVQFHSNIYFD